MPTPIIPKRRRSLGATACAAPRAGSESRKIEPAIKEAPAAPANVCKNARRDKRALFIVSILLWGDSTPLYKFLQATRRTRVRRPKQCPTMGLARENTQQNCCDCRPFSRLVSYSKVCADNRLPASRLRTQHSETGMFLCFPQNINLKPNCNSRLEDCVFVERPKLEPPMLPPGVPKVG